MRPRVHVLGLPHTIVSEAFSHCAFTGKVLRLPLVLPHYHVREYSNGVSESAAAEHVQIFSHEDLVRFGGGTFELLKERCTVLLTLDTDLQQAWLALVMRELRARVKAGDVIAFSYPFEGYQKIVQALPDCVCIETGIGYSHPPLGAYRVFESESWRAWHFGAYCGNNGGLGDFPLYAPACCSAVVPNYYDAEQWPLGLGLGMTLEKLPATGDGSEASRFNYVFFAGRMTSSKGIELVNGLAERFPDLTFVVASGEAFPADRFPAKNILFVGRVESRADMAGWMGGALCTLVPSRFHEPFGGVAVEALMCGTPVICSDWAAFTETVQHGRGPDVDDGIRCNDFSEFVQALEHVLGEPVWNHEVSRVARRERAQARYGLPAVADKYTAAIEMFRRMHAEGLRP